LQSEEFRAGTKVVAIDPSAPFAAVLRDRKLLPNATLVVDHWHLHRLANLMVTQVRQRGRCPEFRGTSVAARDH